MESLITESITEEIFIIRRKIDLLTKIIENFDKIDCSKPTALNYERVYCQNLKKFKLSEIELAKDSLQEKFDELVKQEFRKKRKK